MDTIRVLDQSYGRMISSATRSIVFSYLLFLIGIFMIYIAYHLEFFAYYIFGGVMILIGLSGIMIFINLRKRLVASKEELREN